MWVGISNTINKGRSFKNSPVSNRSLEANILIMKGECFRLATRNGFVPMRTARARIYAYLEELVTLPKK